MMIRPTLIIIALITYTRLLGTLLIPIPSLLTPMMSLAIFSGYFYKRSITGILLTLLSLWISDFAINTLLYQQISFFYAGFIWQYVAYGSLVCLGWQIQTFKLKSFTLCGTLATTLFYLISNFGVWLNSGMYPLSSEGLLACYIAALPFACHTLFGTLLTNTLVFYVIQLKNKELAEQT